jgi:hypothetical protein
VAQEAQAADGFSCFENLATPEFPKTALQQRVDGSVWTWVHVTPQGAVEKIETQIVSAYRDGEKLLKPAVETAIRAAKIRPQCAGKTVPVVFRYQLFGQPTADPQVKSRTEAPNIMYIESQPAEAKG